MTFRQPRHLNQVSLQHGILMIYLATYSTWNATRQEIAVMRKYVRNEAERSIISFGIPYNCVLRYNPIPNIRGRPGYMVDFQ